MYQVNYWKSCQTCFLYLIKGILLYVIKGMGWHYVKAVTYQGTKDVQVKNVEAPKIEHEKDMIVKITSTAICGSDLHLYQGNMPLRPGYIIGHEPMGIVEEVGPGVTKVKKGDRKSVV